MHFPRWSLVLPPPKSVPSMGSTKPILGSELFINNTDSPYLWSNDALWLTKRTLMPSCPWSLTLLRVGKTE